MKSTSTKSLLVFLSGSEVACVRGEDTYDGLPSTGKSKKNLLGSAANTWSTEAGMLKPCRCAMGLALAGTRGVLTLGSEPCRV